jgi:hypothetical protein
MAEKKLKVKIHKISSTQCEPTPRHFQANPGSEVTFEFDQEPDADINFLGPSPFDTPSVKAGLPHIVKNEGKFQYDVKWRGGGNGNGTGEVITG